MKKNSNLTLYVLKFRDLPLIKIGKSKSLGRRINRFRKIYGEEFDLLHSYAVGCHSAAKIHALENELLANTIEFGMPEEYLDKFKNLDGSTEIRNESCLQLVLKLIRSKVRITGEFLIYTSISLEKNINSNLPLGIFNDFGETDYVPVNLSAKLLEVIKAKTDEEFQDMDYEEIANTLLKYCLLYTSPSPRDS